MKFTSRDGLNSSADPKVVDLWESIRDDLPESFWEASFWRGSSWTTGRLDVADRKRITLALARMIREREFEAIKAANLRAIKHELETPSRGHGECCGE